MRFFYLSHSGCNQTGRVFHQPACGDFSRPARTLSSSTAEQGIFSPTRQAPGRKQPGIRTRIFRFLLPRGNDCGEFIPVAYGLRRCQNKYESRDYATRIIYNWLGDYPTEFAQRTYVIQMNYTSADTCPTPGYPCCCSWRAVVLFLFSNRSAA